MKFGFDYQHQFDMRKKFNKVDKVIKTTTNNKEYKLALKMGDERDECLICGHNEGENRRTRVPKRGVKKPKYKDKR